MAALRQRFGRRVAPARRSPAPGSYRQVPRYILPPQVNRAVGAHREIRVKRPFTSLGLAFRVRCRLDRRAAKLPVGAVPAAERVSGGQNGIPLGDIGNGCNAEAAHARSDRFPGTVERRLTSRDLSNWRAVGGGASLPSRSRPAAAMFGDDWKSCFTLNLDGTWPHPGIADPVFVHVGERVIELTDAGSALAGRTLAEVTSRANETLIAAALRHVGVVSDRRVPVSQGGQAEFRGREIFHRFLLLPFAGDAGEIRAILGAPSARAALGRAQGTVTRHA